MLMLMLTRLKGVMLWIEDKCRSDGLLPVGTKISNMTRGRSDELFRHSYILLMEYLYGPNIDVERC
jgi:hypothetical protein